MAAYRYEAVVFDNDGVLTHPTELSALEGAIEATFEAFDATPDPDHLAVVVDEPTADAVTELADACDVDPETFWRRHEREMIDAQLAALRSGAKPLYDDFDAVRELPVRTAVVSNNQHETIENIVEVFDLDGVFEVCYGRHPSLDGMARRKPDPHYLERALDELGTRSVLYVGDSNVDIEAAAAAGVDSAFVARPHREGYTLASEPTHRIDGLREIHEVLGLVDSPAAPNDRSPASTPHDR